jgi:hypothetical protein
MQHQYEASTWIESVYMYINVLKHQAELFLSQLSLVVANQYQVCTAHVIDGES